MKKIFTVLVSVLFATSMFAQFGILVNGSKYFAGTHVDDFDGFTQYLAHVPVVSGDRLQLCDAGSNYATWAVDLDGASISGFTRDGDHYNVSASGCFDFYIKIKNAQDQLYIGPGSAECGAGQDITGGQGGGGGQGGNVDAYWYWKGDLDDTKIENEMHGNKFEAGLSEISVTNVAYIFVIYQQQGVQGVQYMTDGWQGFEVTHATMTNCGICTNGNKLYLPAGNYTLYLYDNGDGTVELSREPLAGKTLMGGESQQGIDNTKVMPKNQKIIVDGELRIIYGDKIYDATGRQL